jgi:hypothetical protein
MDCATDAVGPAECPPAHVVVAPTTVAGLTVGYDSGWYYVPVPEASSVGQKVATTVDQVEEKVCPYPQPGCWYPPDR